MKSKQWFEGISSLRFLAALAVVISHIELLKWENAYPNLYKYHSTVSELGSAAVLFFFVLSGFLISYLLIKEKEQNQTIAIKKFYYRRIFRIWPVYLLCVLFVFLFFSKIEMFDVIALKYGYDLSGLYWPQFLLYVLFVPNLAFSFYGPFPHIGQAWSIGVEEQFYFIWPIVFKKMKMTFKVLVLLIIGLIVIKFIYFIFFSFLPINHATAFDLIKSFIVMSKIESMMIGGAFAMLLINNASILKYVYHPVSEILSYIISILILYFYPQLGVFQNGIYLVQSILFAIIILNVASNSRPVFRFNFPILEKLGNYSYALYMVHMIVIMFVIGLFRANAIEISNHFWPQLALYTISISLSIGICYFIHKFIEIPIAKIKDKYGKV